VGECASLHEARKGLLPLTGFAGPKIGVSFGIIDDDGDADLREMVMDRCAVVLECLPHLFVGLAVDNAVHQPDDGGCDCVFFGGSHWRVTVAWGIRSRLGRSEEHTSELQSRFDLVCRLPLAKKDTCNTEYGGED